MSNLAKTYVVFRVKKIRIETNPGFEVLNISDFLQRMHDAESSEEIQTPKRAPAPKHRTIYQYIKIVSSLKEVSEIVRAAPLDKYVLFEGVMHTLSAPIQVLLDGKPVETLEAEWTVEPGIEITDDIRNLEIDEDDADLVIPPKFIIGE